MFSAGCRAYEESIAEDGAPQPSPEKDEKRIFVQDPETVLEASKLTGYEAIKRLTPYRGK